MKNLNLIKNSNFLNQNLTKTREMSIRVILS